MFTQICDQFMPRGNYVRIILGLSVLILPKITATTLLQYINSKNERNYKSLVLGVGILTA